MVWLELNVYFSILVYVKIISCLDCDNIYLFTDIMK